MIKRYWPPEWHPQTGLVVAWPYLEKEWEGLLGKAQDEWLSFLNAFAQNETGYKIHLLVPDEVSKNFIESKIDFSIKNTSFKI